jgi:hypothetical protein
MGLPFLVLLGACEAKPECDSPETRSAVLDAISSDHQNALGEFAAQQFNNGKRREFES